MHALGHDKSFEELQHGGGTARNVQRGLFQRQQGVFSSPVPDGIGKFGHVFSYLGQAAIATVADLFRVFTS